MTKKADQKIEESSTSGPLRKHRSRTEKIDDLKKQLNELRKAEREERKQMRDEKFLAIGKALWEKAGKPKNIYGLQQYVESEDFKVEFTKDF
ncbi:hypothetical protein D9555_21025 [Shigella sonnei]|nr:hypothetical protein [Shigella sonnei]